MSVHTQLDPHKNYVIRTSTIAQ